MRNLRALNLLLGLIFLVSCTASEKREASNNEIVNLEPRDFEAKLSSLPDGVLIDVRTPEEVSGGMIEGAINIDFKDPSFGEKISALDKDKPYFVYCLSGKRSGEAAKQMESAGFKNVYLLKEGYQKWTSDGLETVKPSN